MMTLALLSVHACSGPTPVCATAAFFYIPGAVLEQEDTFFKAPNGRLKVSI